MPDASTGGVMRAERTWVSFSRWEVDLNVPTKALELVMRPVGDRPGNQDHLRRREPQNPDVRRRLQSCSLPLRSIGTTRRARHDTFGRSSLFEANESHEFVQIETGR